MLEAIVLDFNGVIVNDEHVHYLLLREVMAPFGLNITTEDYLNKYVVFGDEDAFAFALDESGQQPTTEAVERLVREKRRRYLEEAVHQIEVFPGVTEFIREASAVYPLAIASGAAREEVLSLLKHFGLDANISAIVAAEDVKNRKPAPDAYLAAVQGLKREGRNVAAIEDTPGGIMSAKQAGLRAVAVPNTFPVEALAEADLVLPFGLNPAALSKIKAMMQTL